VNVHALVATIVLSTLYLNQSNEGSTSPLLHNFRVNPNLVKLPLSMGWNGEWFIQMKICTFIVIVIIIDNYDEKVKYFYFW